MMKEIIMSDYNVSADQEVVALPDMLAVNEPIKKSPLMPTSWRNAFDFIDHLTRLNEMLIVVLGNHLSGKSTYASLIIDTFTPIMETFLVTATIPFNEDDLVRLMVARYHLNETRTLSFADVVKQLSEMGQKALIVIDDAQFITASFLHNYLQLIESGYGQVCHICIISDFSIVGLLNSQIKTYPDRIHSIEIGALTFEEMIVFVEQMNSDDRLLPKLSVKIWQTFYQLTQGKIDKIHLLFPAWRAGLSVDVSSNDQYYDMIKRIGLSFGALAILAVGVYQWMVTTDNLTSIPFRQDTYLASNVTSEATLPTSLNLASSIPAAPLFPSKIARIDLNTMSPIQKNVITSKANSVEHHTPNIKRTQLSYSQPVKRMDNSNVAIKSPFALSQKDRKESRTHLIADKKKKATFAAHGYTIQLAAFPNMIGIQKVTRQFPSHSFHVATVRSKGREWYVLTYGQYKTHAEAKAHIPKLADLGRTFTPWIRETNQLQLKR
jgi:hypothetical protein